MSKHRGFVLGMLLFTIVLSLLISSSLILIYAQNSSSVPRCANYDSKSNIINVTCNTNLSGIYKDINNRKILQKNPNGVWVLNASIVVNPQSKITINNSDTSWLKITNKNATEPNYISILGSAQIDHIKITSWNPSLNDTIKQNVDGSSPRPYIMAIKAVGNVDISNSEVAFLGYNLYPSNGLVYERGGNGSNIINNNFHNMWDGFYSNHVGFVTIKNNTYHDNLRNGVDTESGSHDFNIIGNLAYNNNAIGITCSENCYNILFDSNTLHNNNIAGLMFSLQANNSIAKKNFVYNEKVGISLYSSSNNAVYNNLLRFNNIDIFVGGNSTDNRIYNNTLMDSNIGLNFADNPKNNQLENNPVNNITTSIHSSNNQLENVGSYEKLQFF